MIPELWRYCIGYARAARGQTPGRCEDCRSLFRFIALGHTRASCRFRLPEDPSIEEAAVFKMGDFIDGAPPLVRIHSQCLTGDVFHSLRCDCLAQQEIAFASIAYAGGGLLIYELQDGRGIGFFPHQAGKDGPSAGIRRSLRLCGGAGQTWPMPAWPTIGFE